MKFKRLAVLCSIAFIAVSWFYHTPDRKKTKSSYLTQQEPAHQLAGKSDRKLEQKAAEAKEYCRQKRFNADACFLIDMSLPSGQNRFFIYDLKRDSIQATGLVAHGNCFEYWLEGRRYSNVVGSGCTSLGRYKTGASYTGKWGYSYKLHGLDSTNNNAFERTVVLHSHSCVAEAETSEEICQSNGCPTVSPGFLEKLKRIINSSQKPVLLWIFE